MKFHKVVQMHYLALGPYTPERQKINNNNYYYNKNEKKFLIVRSSSYF